jgi:hypothetical protein
MSLSSATFARRWSRCHAAGNVLNQIKSASLFVKDESGMLDGRRGNCPDAGLRSTLDRYLRITHAGRSVSQLKFLVGGIKTLSVCSYVPHVENLYRTAGDRHIRWVADL